MEGLSIGSIVGAGRLSMQDPRPWKGGDLVRIKDTGEPALIVKVTDASFALGRKMIKIHTGEYFAPWKINLVSKVEERRER